MTDFDFDALPPPNREQMRWLLLRAAQAHLAGDKADAERLLDEAFFLRDLLLLVRPEKADA